MKMLAAIALSEAVLAAPLQAQPANTAPTCIRPFDFSTGSVDHTHVVNPTTILFYMRDGKIWKNALRQPCRGLTLHGFVFTTQQDEVCSNAQSIRVIQTGEICQLGEFTRYVPLPANAPAY